MALRILNNTPRGTAASDSGLATGTAHLWWQIRFKGSFLLDRPADNSFVRFFFSDDPSQFAISDSTTYRFAISFRKLTATSQYQFELRSRRDDDSSDRVFATTIAIATLDAQLDPDEWYTWYMHAWPSDGTDMEFRLLDDAGTVLQTNSSADGANVHAIGTHDILRVFHDSPSLTEIDAIAFGVDRLATADRFVSPEVHEQALRYWLFEDGAGSAVVEGTGNGQNLAISGTEDTDFEWFAGDWGAGAALGTPSITVQATSWDALQVTLAEMPDGADEVRVYIDTSGSIDPDTAELALTFTDAGSQFVTEFDSAGLIAETAYHLLPVAADATDTQAGSEASDTTWNTNYNETGVTNDAIVIPLNVPAGERLQNIRIRLGKAIRATAGLGRDVDLHVLAEDLTSEDPEEHIEYVDADVLDVAALENGAETVLWPDADPGNRTEELSEGVEGPASLTVTVTPTIAPEV